MVTLWWWVQVQIALKTAPFFYDRLTFYGEVLMENEAFNLFSVSLNITVSTDGVWPLTGMSWGLTRTWQFYSVIISKASHSSSKELQREVSSSKASIKPLLRFDVTYMSNEGRTCLRWTGEAAEGKAVLFKWQFPEFDSVNETKEASRSPRQPLNRYRVQLAAGT